MTGMNEEEYVEGDYKALSKQPSFMYFCNFDFEENDERYFE